MSRYFTEEVDFANPASMLQNDVTDLIKTCRFLIRLYDDTNTENKKFELPDTFHKIQSFVDHAINRINLDDLYLSQKEKWMSHKFRYVSYIRDILIKYPTKKIIPYKIKVYETQDQSLIEKLILLQDYIQDSLLSWKRSDKDQKIPFWVLFFEFPGLQNLKGEFFLQFGLHSNPLEELQLGRKIKSVPCVYLFGNGATHIEMTLSKEISTI
jgi:hypothetical protein